MKKKRSTPTKAKAPSSGTLVVDLKEMVTRKKVIKEEGVLGQGELRSITVTVVSPRIIKDLRANVTIVERMVTWRRIAGSKGLQRVTSPT